MNKINLLKNITIAIIGVAIIFAFTNVLAADNNTYQDLSQAISGNNGATGNSQTGNNSALTNNALGTNNSSSNRANNNGVFNTNALASNNSLSNNSASNSYSNTTLPRTGIESVAPIAVLLVIFGISAIYAYKKIKDYKNI